MPFSPVGMVVAAAMTSNVKDPNQKTTLELMGGLLGTTPIGLVLVAALAQQAGSTSGTSGSTAGSTSGSAIGGTSGSLTSGPASGTTAPTETQVPDIARTDDIATATALIQARGLTVAGTEQVISDEPIDTIIGSSPAAGALVGVGTAVTVLASAGVPVPNVTGQKVSAARQTLRQIGFEPEERSADKRGPADTVITQDPAGGDYASVGDTVILEVYKGTEGAAGRTRKTPAAAVTHE